MLIATQVSLNTHYCNLENPYAYVDESSDIGNQWHWFYETLSAAKEAAEKVIVIAHIPPGVLDTDPAPEWLTACRVGYATAMNDFSDIIVGQFYGHMFHFLLLNLI